MEDPSARLQAPGEGHCRLLRWSCLGPLPGPTAISPTGALLEPCPRSGTGLLACNLLGMPPRRSCVHLPLWARRRFGHSWLAGLGVAWEGGGWKTQQKTSGRDQVGFRPELGGANPCEWLNPPHLLLGRNWLGSHARGWRICANQAFTFCCDAVRWFGLYDEIVVCQLCFRAELGGRSILGSPACQTG